MNSIGIAGVGLIGGSFALAVRDSGFAGEILGVSSPITIERAIELNAIDRGVTLEEAARCDLLFLAQPVAVIVETLRKLPAIVGPQTVITDAGSTKRAIADAAKGLANFVGGHPMAGKETHGVDSADADLFRGRPWLLTAEPPAALRNLIEMTGARITVLSPEDHDRLVALVSHAPQMVSNAIAAATASQRAFGGPGLESMTRLSASSYSVWRDILTTNRDETAGALDVLIAEIERLRDALNAGDWKFIESSFRPRR